MAVSKKSVVRDRDYFGTIERYIDQRIENKKSGVLITLNELANRTGYKCHPNGEMLRRLKTLYESKGWRVNTTWEYVELS